MHWNDGRTNIQMYKQTGMVISIFTNKLLFEEDIIKRLIIKRQLQILLCVSVYNKYDRTFLRKKVDPNNIDDYLMLQ